MRIDKWDEIIRHSRVSRRTFFGVSIAAAGTLLAACGGTPEEDEPESTTSDTGESNATSSDESNATGATATSSGGSEPETEGTASESTSDGEPTSDSSDAENEEPQEGGTLVIADPMAGGTLDPFKATWHSTAQFLVYSSYVDQNPDLEYVPYTLTSWEISPDGKEVTFEIHPDMTFSDGTPVTADAIKFVLERMIDPELHVPNASSLGPLESVEVIDDKTAKFIYSTSYAPLFNGLSGVEVPSAEAVKKYGEDFGNHPIGAGPYLVTEQIQGNQIKYERNPDYKWPPPYYANRGPAYFDGVSMRVISEDSTIWSALQSGEVHIGPIAPTYVKDAQNTDNVTVMKQLDSGIRYLGMNCSKPPFDNELVRQAVSHAVNRQVIVDVALDGYGKVLYSPLAYPIKYSDNEAMKAISYRYDVDAAKAKLEEAGYDVSGEWATKDGKTFETELMVRNADFFKRAAQILQGQLKEAGIKVNVRVMDSSALNEATTTGNHQMFITLYGSSSPSILYYFFSSSRLRATNRAWYTTPELDSLLDKARSEMDEAKQKELYEEIQTTVVKASPWVVLCDPYTFTGVSKDVQGFSLHPNGGYLLHDAWLKQ